VSHILQVNVKITAKLAKGYNSHVKLSWLHNNVTKIT